MLDYVLEENLLTENPNDRTARVVNVQSYTEEDLADAIAKRNIGISKSEVLAVLEAEAEVQLEWIAGGNSIKRRLAHFHHAIPGVYREGEHPEEAVVRITASKEVSEVAKNVPLRHVEPTTQMGIDFVTDVRSGAINEKITPGGVVKITGYNLKVAGPDESAAGIAFVSVANRDVVYPVPAIDVITNNPSELIIIAPAMTPTEEVFLRVTTQYLKSTKFLKEPRSVTFGKKLTVV